jgi:hypothetical protein
VHGAASDDATGQGTPCLFGLVRTPATTRAIMSSRLNFALKIMVDVKVLLARWDFTDCTKRPAPAASM